MNNFDADWVTIERAAGHLDISVAEALELAQRSTGIQRSERKGATVYRLSWFVKIHLKEAVQQWQDHLKRGLPEVAVVRDDDTHDKDDPSKLSRMRWMDDGGPEESLRPDARQSLPA